MQDAPLERGSRRDLRLLRPALRFLAPYRWRLVGASIALVLTAGVTLSIGQGIRLLIDSGFAQGTEEMLLHSIFGFAGLILLLTGGTFVRFYLVSWVGERVAADLRRAVFNHIITLHPGYFEKYRADEIAARITTDTVLLENVMGSSASIGLRSLLTFVGGVILLFVTNPYLSVFVVIAVPCVVLPLMFLGRRVRLLSRSSLNSIAHAGSYVSETLRQIKTVQAYTHEAVDIVHFGARVEAAFAIAARRIRHRALLVSVIMMLVLAAISGMLWVGGRDVLSGQTTVGELTAFLFYAFLVAGSVGAISEVYSDLQRAAGATERLMELLAARSLLKQAEPPHLLPATARGSLVIDGLTFSYPTRLGQRALDGVTMAIRPGERVALVGPSGAGKSTLFDLLLRFHDPAAGCIRLDQVDIRQLTLGDLRRQIALVGQEPVLFTGTVTENIRYGMPQATNAAVRDAAEAAFAADFIQGLPQAYDTELGEGGGRLSGGQRQRIAIARALLRDPRILLLDEATSALDAESEYRVQQALTRLAVGRTTLVIAHRLATVVGADRILVFDRGRLVATGTHSELLKSTLLYARLAELQFAPVAADPLV